MFHGPDIKMQCWKWSGTSIGLKTSEKEANVQIKTLKDLQKVEEVLLKTTVKKKKQVTLALGR